MLTTRRVCCACAAAVFAVTLTGCSIAARPTAAARRDCGTTTTAAGVAVQIEVARGTVACPAALRVETAYARALAAGLAPGNGGGGPVTVSGWTCQGLDTPAALKTGEASRCGRAGSQIVAMLKSPGAVARLQSPRPAPAAG